MFAFEPLIFEIAFDCSSKLYGFKISNALLCHSLSRLSALCVTLLLANGLSIPSNNCIPISSVSPPIAANLLDVVVDVNSLAFWKLNFVASWYNNLCIIFLDWPGKILLACIDFWIPPNVAPTNIQLDKLASSGPHSFPNPYPTAAPINGLILEAKTTWAVFSVKDFSFQSFSKNWVFLFPDSSINFLLISDCFFHNSACVLSNSLALFFSNFLILAILVDILLVALGLLIKPTTSLLINFLSAFNLANVSSILFNDNKYLPSFSATSFTSFFAVVSIVDICLFNFKKSLSPAIFCNTLNSLSETPNCFLVLPCITPTTCAIFCLSALGNNLPIIWKAFIDAGPRTPANAPASATSFGLASPVVAKLSNNLSNDTAAADTPATFAAAFKPCCLIDIALPHGVIYINI